MGQINPSLNGGGFLFKKGLGFNDSHTTTD
jgi:hypothetical protein